MSERAGECAALGAGSASPTLAGTGGLEAATAASNATEDGAKAADIVAGVESGKPIPAAAAKRSEFERLYREWLTARAVLHDPEAFGSDESADAAARAYGTAERALITALAPAPWGVWMKWELLDQLVASEAHEGPRADNIVILALASIKADVLRFGLNDPG